MLTSSPAFLAFAQPPASALANAILPTIAVNVDDAGGAVVDADSSTVTLTLSGGNFSSGINTATANAVNGVATFSSLAIGAAGTYTLAATDGTLAPAASAVFDMYLYNGISNFFPAPYGADSNAALFLDSSGDFYGTTEQGGAYNDGTVFEIAHGGTAITTIASFNLNHPYDDNPISAVVMDSSGNLYGTTMYGGANNDGTVYEIACGSTSLTTLGSFGVSTGYFPDGGLALDSNGNIYGTTEGGGSASDGTLFEISHGSTTITTLNSFTFGSEPVATLTMDRAGDLYGTTSYGGANGDGTVFEVLSGSTAIKTIASFNSTGANPTYTVVLDSGGNLYGTTDATVFEIANGSTAITTLASFNSSNYGSPTDTVILDSSGNLFGTTSAGYGTVFEIAHGSTAMTTLASFNSTNGADPAGPLVMDCSGNLYGTTAQGGYPGLGSDPVDPAGNGTVFEITHGSTMITTFATLETASASQPQAAPVFDSGGNLYGTTLLGGANHLGAVYEIAHGSALITTIASFNSANGAIPAAPVVFDSAGNLYGAATGGGANGDGTVFEIVHGGTTITTLASFNSPNDADPNDVILDSSGNLYGTTEDGGASSFGTIFEIARGSTTITTLATFNSTNGANPFGVVIDSVGNLYGAAENGGASGYGTVFEITHGDYGNYDDRFLQWLSSVRRRCD